MSGPSINGRAMEGALNVVVSQGGHSVDTLTDMCLDKLMYVSPTAPEEVRLQAQAFKNRMREIIRGYLLQARKSERTAVIAELRKKGHTVAAEIIGAL